MRLANSLVAIDHCAKFFSALHVSGWVKHDTETLMQIDLLNCEQIAHKFKVGLSDNVSQNIGGSSLGFTLDVMLKEEVFPFDAFIVFSFSNLKQEMVALYDLVHERLSGTPAFVLYQRFLDMVAAPDFRRVLDVGGRDRSQIDRSKFFGNSDVTVLDILPGTNVDVVGDAHELSTYFAEDSYDAIHSTSVFEHLLMPWKVVLEMNRVLRLGGLVYVHTHQALGMHDMPCDYWRYSADAWPALFNAKTGFEIVDTAMSHEMLMIPFFWRPDQRDAEKSAGFETSVVLARKTSEPAVSWNVTPAEIGEGAYPASP